ncbi:MAG TPA: diguanylate cyclase [Nitrospiria bacterium]|jgi:diguanylate cyclase (GGDEF)-like protein|nr:diguanylate cyclase [Nitrospiria bacterium]
MSKARILLIEDNPLQAKQTQAVVEAGGHEVILAENGGTGFRLAKTQPIDLVLLDVVLPDFSGAQICQWLKRDESTRSVPVIMLTSKGSVEDKVAGLQIGADDYVPKPFSDKELLARIQVCLRTKMREDELRGANDQLENQLLDVRQRAITDAGTGLYNRRHFFELLDREFSRAKRFNEPFSCLMMDIDHFKEINDSFGHPIGDKVLVEIAGILKQSVRLIEVAARYGGEEFVLLLPKTRPNEAIKPATRILESVSSLRFPGFPPDRIITISIGISGLPDSLIASKEDLIRSADFALYKAKRAGRNRIELSDGGELTKGKV